MKVCLANFERGLFHRRARESKLGGSLTGEDYFDLRPRRRLECQFLTVNQGILNRRGMVGV